MADLNKIQSAETVIITDGVSQEVELGSSIPTGSEVSLLVRDACKGQQTGANSRPVVIANDQTPIPISNASTGAVFSVSPLYSLFEYNFAFGENTLFWYTSTATGGSFTFPTNQASCVLNITATNGSTAIRQSQRVLHRIGSFMYCLVNARMGALKSNTRQRIGVFDSNDGIFFEQDGVNFQAVYRTFTSGAAVDTAVNQASFNVDAFDGSGPSGFNLDTSDTNCYGFRWSWQYGIMELGIVVNGIFYVGHRFSLNNTITLPITSWPNYPFRFELQATAAAGSATTMAIFGVSAYSDSGQANGMRRSVDTGGTGNTIAASLEPLLSIRLNPTYNKGLLIVETAQLVATAATQVVYWSLVYNATLGGGTSWTSAGTSAISQYDESSTTISGGTIIYSGYTGYYGNNQDKIDIMNFAQGLLKLSANISGTSDTLTLAGFRTSGASFTVYPAIGYREFF